MTSTNIYHNVPNTMSIDKVNSFVIYKFVNILEKFNTLNLIKDTLKTTIKTHNSRQRLMRCKRTLCQETPRQRIVSFYEIKKLSLCQFTLLLIFLNVQHVDSDFEISCSNLVGNNWKFFYGSTQASFSFIFGHFKQTIGTVLQYINVKKCPSSIW